MFLDNVSGLCVRIMCQDYVSGLCVLSMFLDYVPGLCVTDIEQVMECVTEPLPRVCQTTMNRVLVT